MSNSTHLDGVPACESRIDEPCTSQNGDDGKEVLRQERREPFADQPLPKDALGRPFVGELPEPRTKKVPEPKRDHQNARNKRGPVLHHASTLKSPKRRESGKLIG